MTEAALRLSATILILRDAPALEVLMLRRAQEIDFASGALVFPGGKTSKDDMSEGWRARSDGGFGGAALAARVCAVREAFEESGMLFARRAAERGVGRPLVGADVALALSPQRAGVDRGEVNFLELIAAHDLVLALDCLVEYAHWVTPVFMPVRFDTQFYLAAAPEGQVAEQDGRETTEARWIAPKAALEAEANGSATIIFPTRMNVKRLNLAKNVVEALAELGGGDLPVILPELVEQADGQAFLKIPEVAGYDQTMEPIDIAKIRAIAKRR